MKTLLVTETNGIAKVQLNRPKANAMNHVMINELTETFNSLENNTSVKAAYITGQSPFFSAGLDVIELFNYNEEEIKTFWFDFAEMIKTMASFSKPLIASISGHSPAGGCVLALCADYRIMQEGNFKIGLNEVAVGVVVPNSIFELYSFAIGKQQAYQALLQAKMFTVEEAKAANLIHDVCKADELEAHTLATLQNILKLELNTWKLSKQNIRKELLDKLTVNEANLESTLSHWWSDAGRGTIAALIEGLTKKV